MRGESRTGQAIATGRRPNVKHRVTNAMGGAAGNLVMPQDTQGEGINQRVALVALVEIHLARDRRNAEAIAIVGNAAHHAREQTADLRIRQFAEAQRIERGHRTGAHGKNVADDATHAGRRSLEGLHGTRMVVRFDFEGDGHTVTHVDNARVLFASADEDLVALRREGLQHRSGVLVGAVLRPHH